MTRTTLLAGTILTLIVAMATPGRADTPTEVNEVTPTVTGSILAVSGSASFGTQDRVEVGDDPIGDSLVPLGVGLDFDALYIQRPDGTSPNLTMTMKLDGLTGGGIPEAFQYNWDIMVDGGQAAGGSNWSIKSMRSGNGSQVGNLGPWAALTSCVQDGSPTGGFTCSTQLPLLPVTYDEANGEIRITVALNRIGATGGSRIEAWARNGQPVWVRTSAAGALTGVLNVDDMTHEDYIVPGNTAVIGIAPAGTPEGSVPFNTTATVSGSGFSASLPKPAAGTYDVWAKACYGPDNCGTKKTTITVE